MKQKPVPANPDVTVENHGSIFLFQPHTTAGTVWLTENISDEATWFGPALAVEPRYARDLAQALLEAGLEVR